MKNCVHLKSKSGLKKAVLEGRGDLPLLRIRDKTNNKIK